MKKIFLSGKHGKGKFTFVDNDDFEWLNQWKWHLNNSGYAMRMDYSTSRQKAVLMHRVINKTPTGLRTDHRNTNKLDNRKENLRSATHSQNCFNRIRKNRKFKGVYFNSGMKRKKRWQAKITAFKKEYSLGYYLTSKEAAIAYNNTAIKIHKDFALLNII